MSRILHKFFGYEYRKYGYSSDINMKFLKFYEMNRIYYKVIFSIQLSTNKYKYYKKNKIILYV